MDLKFEITIKGVDDNIKDEKVSEILHDMKFRLEGYSTEPPKGINYNNMSIGFIKTN